MTTSNESSPNGRLSALPRVSDSHGAASRAQSSIRGEGSTPETRQLVAAVSAAA
jgi:hypothetical protein